MSKVGTTSQWVPERVVGHGDEMRCRWVDATGLRYTDPFFDSTLTRRARHEGSERTTTLQAMVDAAATAPPLPPVTFIFHVSRCGSTLLSQLFSLDDRNVVLSEVPLLDAVLGSDRPDREALFAAALRLLCRPHCGARRLVVKTDCWHVFHAALIRRMYPEAPFILLYRSPAGVLASQQKMRGRHMVPGVLVNPPFCAPFNAERMSLNHYAADVLEQHYRAMLDLAAVDRHSLLVSYEEGFPAAFLRAVHWLNLPLNDERRRVVEERCGRHAKRPDEPFGADPSVAPPEVELASLTLLVEQLDRARVVPTE